MKNMQRVLITIRLLCRCESILHPGHNCTMRIEKIKKRSRNKGKQATTQPENYTVYTCHFCSHRNMKRGTPRNASQPMAKPLPESTKEEISNTVSSDMTKGNIATNTRAAPLVPTADDPQRGKMAIVEIHEPLKVKGDSVDVNTPDNSVSSSYMTKNNVDANTRATPLVPTTGDSHRGKMGTVEINEPVKVKDNSVDNSTADNTVTSSDMTKDNIAANTRATPQVPTTDDPHSGEIGIVEMNETSKVKDDPIDINTPDKSKMGTLDITDTLDIKKWSDASDPATPSTRPTLTLLESKMKKRNRAGSKKKVAPESTPIAEKSSKRKRRKSWTTLKEIAESNEKEKRMKLINLTIPFSMK